MVLLSHAEDPRNPLQKLRRRQIYDIARAAGVPFPEGAPKDNVIPLLVSSNIDLRPYLRMITKGPLDGNIGKQVNQVIEKVDYSLMHMGKLKKLAKERGIVTPRTAKKDEIIRMLNG